MQSRRIVSMKFWFGVALLAAGLLGATDLAVAQPPVDATAKSATAKSATAKSATGEFVTEVVPFLREHCFSCHGKVDPQGDLSLESYETSSNVQTDFEVWENVLRMLVERQMPPENKPRPEEKRLQRIVKVLHGELAKFDCGDSPRPGRVTIRRLNRAEYNNTIRDLTGVKFRPADDFPSDDVGNGFDNIGDVLSMPLILVEKYLAAAESVVDAAFADASSRQLVAPHQANDELSERDAVTRNLTVFATRAFRRPITDDEQSRFGMLARNALEQGATMEQAVQTVMHAILASPHFLFRVESEQRVGDEAAGPAQSKLSDFELASRLSFFLWSSMPDKTLFQLAKEQRLHEPEVLRAQALRMLADPKAAALTDNFAGQWLQLRSLDNIKPDPEMFPTFDDSLRKSMRRESELFFESIVHENRSVLEFLTGDFTFVNERLAAHYGIDGVTGESFQRVAVPPQRRGVLTHASILLITSNPTRTSPVKRGKWILDNVLGEPPPPPPEGVAELDGDAETLGSLRERMEQHRADESCAVCHRKMDALGFGLENFDVIGGWRDRDGRFEINPAGSLPGGRDFGTAGELMEILAEEKADDFCRCLTEKMLTYALGRGLQSFDRCTVDDIVMELSENEFRFQSMILAIVTSAPFTAREGEVTP
jgi:hypothetical protein